MEPRSMPAPAGVDGGTFDPGAAWVCLTADDGRGARRRRVAVAGVSLMGAAAVSTAVFQTVTGTSTSLAMTPGLGALFAGVQTPTPQGPAIAPTAVAAPAITDLGPAPGSVVAPPPSTQVGLRALNGPLPGPGGSAGPARALPAAPAPLAGGTAGGFGGSGAGGGAGPGAPAAGSPAGSTGAPSSRPTSTTPSATTDPTSTRPTSSAPSSTAPKPTTPKPTTPKPPSTTTPSPTSSASPSTSPSSSSSAPSASSAPSSASSKPSGSPSSGGSKSSGHSSS
ncbi:hypothetical protein LQ327_24520 [Actinomycetospora endophytica]|uniref:Uncharacterized protein n=1 Tax=Actinomycetospora endophytica TaxID=2291215 RepID=A0ABS8PE39_9PSEU|nr:hypothetical protein [Actinomycetospora endophytica]MCD2196544.1 hypothetical protein [Actinomycetospora endophytica]